MSWVDTLSDDELTSRLGALGIGSKDVDTRYGIEVLLDGER